MNLFWLDQETCRTKRAASALTGSTFTTLASKGGRAGSSPVWPSKQLPNIRPRQQENRAHGRPQTQLWVVTGGGLTLPRDCPSSTGVSGWWKQRKSLTSGLWNQPRLGKDLKETEGFQQGTYSTSASSSPKRGASWHTAGVTILGSELKAENKK